MATTERWTLQAAGRTHLVEVDPAGLGRRVTWRVDGREVGTARSGDGRMRVLPGDGTDAGIGVVALRFGAWGPARRVTWYDGGRESATAAAVVGVGGLDFEPEPGSRAARRKEWIGAHPRLYTVRQTLIGLGTVVGPLLLAALLARLAFSIDLPAIPWPDLPDLPGIPRPDLPDVDLPAVPGWVREVADKAKFVVPVLLAFVLARGEVRCRRAQDDRRRTDPAGR
jgi:hypothetical protein